MEHKKSEEILSGMCGNAVRWHIRREGGSTVLTIDGNGRMTDYSSKEDTPYFSFSGDVSNVVVKPGVTYIGDYAFSGLKSLTSVELPSTVEYVGSCAFAACTALQSVTLPEGLRVIGPKAFDKCASLISISLPSSLTAVDFKAFKSAGSLNRVEYAGTKTQWDRQVRVSRSSLGNEPLLNAEFIFAPTTKRYNSMISEISSVIKHGGDGRFYIATPDLTVDNVPGKSGDCMLFVFPDGQTMMIDTGAPDSECHVMNFIKKTDIVHLNHFVLSHPHSDHIGNSLKVAKYLYETANGSIGEYYYSGFEYKADEKKLTAYLSEHGSRMHRNMRAGDILKIGSVSIEFFNPFEEDMHPENLGDGPVNNVSLVMKFTYGKSTFLAGGDIYADRENMLAAKYGSRLKADVAKTNHHGCFTSNTDIWYDAVNPKILFSDCDDNIWTLFSEKLASRNIRHYKVSDCGLTVISMGAHADYLVETEF
jgi:beta-lactamase superfamily II metal-dependent hydrolase